ncbi:MAG TPA: ATP-dependent protease ATPase subunit HslU [Candidatus Hydrogenedentes bacterium]|nr:ATP-dependent protease ATPase subunit HslU [Candidatus Hydrogenedentota bacterium]
MKNLTPKDIVRELDRHIIGQDEAKKKVAIALRNRWRRQQLPDDLRDEVAPKNILMIGPTGVGKTEIARRLSKLDDAPFIKVEASKFTEVGYVGRDCESMIRELVETGIKMVREEMQAECGEKARENARKRLIDLLYPGRKGRGGQAFHPLNPSSGDEGPARNLAQDESDEKVRRMVAEKLDAGELEEKEVDLTVREQGGPQMSQLFAGSGLEEIGMNMQEVFARMAPPKTRTRRVTVAEARELLVQEELQELVDMDLAARRAVERVENSGIIFLDEIDKIAGRGQGAGQGPDVSREGVQRDILPIVEGSTVMTKYGPVRTDHILFIAAGAFHVSKVSDLIPELQGRFPIRVELASLTAADFARILRETHNSLIRQYEAMLATEGVALVFEDAAIDLMAEICAQVNQESENIGARRLHTIMEYLLEDLSFDAQKHAGATVTVTVDMVRERLSGTLVKQDLSRYIL